MRCASPGAGEGMPRPRHAARRAVVEAVAENLQRAAPGSPRPPTWCPPASRCSGRILQKLASWDHRMLAINLLAALWLPEKETCVQFGMMALHGRQVPASTCPVQESGDQTSRIEADTACTTQAAQAT